MHWECECLGSGDTCKRVPLSDNLHLESCLIIGVELDNADATHHLWQLVMCVLTADTVL